MNTLTDIHDSRLKHLAAKALKLRPEWEILGDNCYRVQSTRFKGVWYEVTDRGEAFDCQCAGQGFNGACLHIALIVAHMYPPISLTWDFEDLNASLDRDAAERQEWAVKALKKRQAVFNGLLKERGRVAMRVSKAKPDGSFEEVTAGGKSGGILQHIGTGKPAEKIHGIRI
jgi:hypothetical protein